MTVFFTSDTHFGHERIITLCERPYDTVAQMDAGLVENWNAKIGPKDEVYHLGDFSFRSSRPAREFCAELNGTIHLIRGNHDGKTLKYDADCFASIHDILEMKCKKQRLVLCHYPMREWPGARAGVWHLFGHMHGRLDHEPRGLSLDVGVDSHNMAPLSFDEVSEIMTARRSAMEAGHSSNPFI